MKTVTRSATSPDQQGDRNLASDGMANGSSQRARAQGFGGNQQAGRTDPNKTINMGRGPTVGNTGKPEAGPATPPAAGVPDFRKFLGPQDGLNFGSQERTPGGTRSWMPSATENYRGDTDRINSGRGPTKGNKQ